MWQLHRVFTAVAMTSAMICGFSARAAEMQVLYLGDDSRRVDMNIIGTIEAGDDSKFKATVLDIIRRGNWIGNIGLLSNGGNLQAALSIGEQIRTLRASTSAPNFAKGHLHVCVYTAPTAIYDRFTHKGDSHCNCSSACFLIWIGGWGRHGNVLGIHRPSFNPKDYAGLSAKEAEITYNNATSSARVYLQKMSVADNIINLMFATSSIDIHYLEPQEVQSFIGMPPYIDELLIARCGAPMNSYSPDEAQIAYQKCSSVLYEEESSKGCSRISKKISIVVSEHGM